MSLDLPVLRAANLPPDYCFTTYTQLAKDVLGLGHVVFPNNFSTVNFGPDEPAPEDRIWPWIKTDAFGNFVGVFTWSDTFTKWVTLHPLPSGLTMLAPSSLASPTDVGNYDGGVAADPVTPTTGPFWEVDGDFAAKFPIGPGSLPDTMTAIVVGDTGGEERHELTEAELPEHRHGPGGPDDQQRIIRVDDNEGSDGLGLALDADGTTQSYEWTQPAGGGQKHNTMPPYRARYFMRRTDRLYRTG